MPQGRCDGWWWVCSRRWDGSGVEIKSTTRTGGTGRFGSVLKEFSNRSDIKGLFDIFLFIIALLVSGYLCIISWGSWWCIPALLLYGNIFYCKVISVQHETNHETYFKSRWLNKFFYHITSLLGGFESVRWKWSHFHHHTYTIFTHEEVYDYENNSPRPTFPKCQRSHKDVNVFNEL